jgi:hypothetical protein
MRKNTGILQKNKLQQLADHGHFPLNFSGAGPNIPPPASPVQFKELQVAVGYLLYYGRSVNARILTAIQMVDAEDGNFNTFGNIYSALV